MNVHYFIVESILLPIKRDTWLLNTISRR